MHISIQKPANHKPALVVTQSQNYMLCYHPRPIQSCSSYYIPSLAVNTGVIKYLSHHSIQQFHCWEKKTKLLCLYLIHFLLPPNIMSHKQSFPQPHQMLPSHTCPYLSCNKFREHRPSSEIEASVMQLELLECN